MIVEVRKVKIGEGIPKICVPIVGKTKEDIINEVNAFDNIPLDLVEWRGDFFEDIFNEESVKKVLGELRLILGDIPLLFTFRTLKEGGEREVDPHKYCELNKRVIETGQADLIDVELFTGKEIVKDIIDFAHDHGAWVIGSNHDFQKTPPKEEIIARLKEMKDLGADIPKIAIMPNSKKDVLALLEATLEATEKYNLGPIITMSMSNLGAISRAFGEFFGSSITFASAGRSSAPGQIEVKELDSILKAIHKTLI